MMYILFSIAIGVSVACAVLTVLENRHINARINKHLYTTILDYLWELDKTIKELDYINNMLNELEQEHLGTDEDELKTDWNDLQDEVG